MAAPQPVAPNGTTEASSGTSGVNQLDLAKPSGAGSGDLVIAAFSKANTATISSPGAYWNEVAVVNRTTALQLAVYWTDADNVDPDVPETWGWSGSAHAAGVAVAYSGSELSGPIDVFGYLVDTPATPPGSNNDIIRAPSVDITATGADTRLLHIVAKNSHEATTPPSGYAEIAERRCTANFTPVVEISDRTGHSDPTGTAEATTSGQNSGARIGMHLVLVGVASGGATVTGAAALSAGGSLATVGSATASGSAVLSAQTTTAAAAVATSSGTAVLSAQSTLVAAAAATSSGAAALSSQSSLVAVAIGTTSGATALSAQSGLSVAGSGLVGSSAAFTAETAVSAVGSATGRGAAALAAGTSLTAVAFATTSGSSTLAGQAVLQASITGEITGEAVLAGGGALSATGARGVEVAADLAASASLAASGSATAVAIVAVSGQASLAAVGVRSAMGSADLAVTSELVATGGGGSALRRTSVVTSRRTSDGTPRRLSVAAPRR